MVGPCLEKCTLFFTSEIIKEEKEEIIKEGEEREEENLYCLSQKSIIALNINSTVEFLIQKSNNNTNFKSIVWP